jgi:hypothetical protein
MYSDHQQLITRLIERASDPLRASDVPRQNLPPPRERYPPLPTQQVANVEARLGFRLPPLLRAIYLQVCNGGVGPGYGLIGCDGGPSIYDGDLAGCYLASIQEDPPLPFHPWPHQFITIGDWGCNMTAELLWTNPEAPVFFFDGNYYDPEQPWETAMKIEAPSLSVWLETWLDK